MVGLQIDERDTHRRVRDRTIVPGCALEWRELQIRLNGDPYEIAGPLTVAELLARLEIDARRVAVEHNLVVLKRDAFDRTAIGDGDEIEIVNFVGGG